MNISHNPENSLLLCKNILLKGKRYILEKIKNKREFIVPAILKKHLNGNTIKIVISVFIKNNDILKKDNTIDIDINSAKVIDDLGLSYYMNLHNEKLSDDDLINLALLKK